jgi:hypothetical protein
MGAGSTAPLKAGAVLPELFLDLSHVPPVPSRSSVTAPYQLALEAICGRTRRGGPAGSEHQPDADAVPGTDAGEEGDQPSQGIQRPLGEGAPGARVTWPTDSGSARGWHARVRGAGPLALGQAGLWCWTV